MLQKYCATCRILDPKQNVCQLLRTEVNPQKDYCTKHKEHLDTCELCGRQVIDAILTPAGDSWKTLCAGCAEKLNSCAFCKNVGTCSFESDPSSLPKVVQKQIRQGNMITVATVRNPERVAITCQNDCSCYDPNFECMRQFNYCERIDHIYDNNSERNDSRATEDSGDGSEVHSKIHE